MAARKDSQETPEKVPMVNSPEGIKAMRQGTNEVMLMILRRDHPEFSWEHKPDPIPTTCSICGEVLHETFDREGRQTTNNYGSHVKTAHPEAWDPRPEESRQWFADRGWEQ